MKQTTRVVSDLARVDCARGRWTVRWPSFRRAAVRGMASTVTVDGTTTDVSGPVSVIRGGGALRLVDSRPDLELSVTARPVGGQSSVMFIAGARNTGKEPITIDGLTTVQSRDCSIGAAGEAEPVVYVDSGGQGGTHMAKLGTGQETAGICAIHNPTSGLGLLCAFIRFEHDNSVTVAPHQGALQLVAASATPVTLQPGEEHLWDPVLLDCRRSPFEMLEEYASVVRDTVKPPVPTAMPMGWLSWYAYRLLMTEDIVLQNAEVVARHFLKYGVNMIHPDHGWQYKDICGNWVANEKFPHGMRWLSDRLQSEGMSLGLWAAPSTVSEFAPLAQDHPEALMTDGKGEPVVVSEKWYWPPHGKVFNVDPLKPEGERFLRDFGRLMRSYGIVYVKADFIGGWGGARRLRRGMAILREALGQDVIVRPCSTALNTQLGVCNEIGIARDIGNAGGDLATMRLEMLELGSKWFMHNKFWHNNPDVLIVGDDGETLGEARGRVTLLALTGGVVFLGDRMPELEKQPERLKLCSLVLPSSGQPARPIDLFRAVDEDRDYPRVWQLRAATQWGQWEVVGVFNWSDEVLTETISRTDLGLQAGDHLVWDFWHRRLIGKLGRGLGVDVEPRNVRCLRIMPLPDRPAVLSTDMHVTQGLVELAKVRWNAQKAELSGEAIRAPGEHGAVYVYVPAGHTLREGSQAEVVAADCVRVPIEFTEARARWAVRFVRP